MLVAETGSLSSLPRSAATLSCAMAAKYAGVWLNFPPPCIHIAIPAVAQPDHLWFAAYQAVTGVALGLQRHAFLEVAIAMILVLQLQSTKLITKLITPQPPAENLGQS